MSYQGSRLELGGEACLCMRNETFRKGTKGSEWVEYQQDRCTENQPKESCRTQNLSKTYTDTCGKLAFLLSYRLWKAAILMRSMVGAGVWLLALHERDNATMPSVLSRFYEMTRSLVTDHSY